MKPSLRQVLADSHVGAIGIAVLLFWSIESVFWGLWMLRGPFYRAVEFVVTAAAIRGIPSFSGRLNGDDRLTLFVLQNYVFYSLVDLTAAWLLSRWLYGSGPLRSLSKHRLQLTRGNRA